MVMGWNGAVLRSKSTTAFESGTARLANNLVGPNFLADLIDIDRVVGKMAHKLTPALTRALTVNNDAVSATGSIVPNPGHHATIFEGDGSINQVIHGRPLLCIPAVEAEIGIVPGDVAVASATFDETNHIHGGAAISGRGLKFTSCGVLRYL